MKNIVKFILIIFLFFWFNLVHSRNLDKYYKSDKISNYFSGLLSLYDNEYASSYKFLKELEGLEDKHSSSDSYQFSLINSGKFMKPINIQKSLKIKN